MAEAKATAIERENVIRNLLGDGLAKAEDARALLRSEGKRRRGSRRAKWLNAAFRAELAVRLLSRSLDALDDGKAVF